MDKLKILVIEDESLAREVMAGNLAGQAVDFAADRASAERKLKAGHYDICFVDLLLGDKDDYSGLKLIPPWALTRFDPLLLIRIDPGGALPRGNKDSHYG